MSDRAGTRALVLGGSGALGQAVCRLLAARGARVAFTYHRGEQAAAALGAALPGALALPLDVTSIPDLEAAVDRAADALGGLTALVHCAAVGVAVERQAEGSHHRLGQIDEAGWDQLLAVNTKSAFFAVKRLQRHLDPAGGNVVLLGSVDGVKPVPTPVHYAASKAALCGMAMAMAKELGERRVLVNVVAPGVLEAGLSRTLPLQLRQEYEKHCGLRRVGTLAEAAELVVWLATENTYVTGRTILLDGAL